MKKKVTYTFVWKKSNPILKISLGVLIVFSMAALAALGWVHAGICEQTEQLREQARKLNTRNQVLEQRIADEGTDRHIAEIATEELGMVSSKTILIQPEQ